MPGGVTPRRALGWATLVNMTGSGAYIAGLTVFLVQTRSVSAAAAAVCILVSTLGGKFGALPLASVIDRLGGRTTYVSTKVVSGLAAAALLAVSSPVVITGCLIVYGLFSAVGGSARNVIIRDIAQTETKIYRAKLRSLANTGIVLGSSVAAAALAWDVPRGAVACMAVNAVSCLACAGLVVAGVPATGPERPGPTDKGQISSPTVSVWRLLVRPRLATFLVVSAVFSLMTPVLTYAVPLWISRYTYPHDAWPVGILVATNAVIVIVLQVPLGRLVDRRDRPDAVMVLAGVTLGAGLATAGASAVVSGQLSLVVVWLAVVLVSLAEVLFSAATTELLFAPEMASHLSRTSSLFTFACAVGEAVGPVLLLAVALRPAAIGWFAVAAAVWVCALFYLRAAALLRSREAAERAAAV
ncbi:MFS transporter [Streptomyces sp. NBC_00879]|uniref:MFS transporter n=1 Tax=Streptomyces sp. NBC_00879 TaxID=2975855 RepID=UPI00386B0065|nr:MFS transporter [Streptomyces sp. NBC_00879]